MVLANYCPKKSSSRIDAHANELCPFIAESQQKDALSECDQRDLLIHQIFIDE